MYFKTLIFLFLFQISLLHSKIITVSPNGSIPSIEVAAYYAEPGDIIEIKGGIYTERQNVWGWRNGTADQPITLRPAEEETVIFDGSYVSYTEAVSFVNFNKISNWIIQGPIEIRNCPQGGFQAIESVNVTVSNLTIHDTKMWGLLVSGFDIVVEDNEVYNCVMSNEYSTADYGWSQCVMTWAWDYNRGEMSRNVTWQRNNIHDAWGEGIDIILCEGCTAKENNITNAFSVLLYIDNSRNVTVEKNVLRQNTDKYNTKKGFRPAGVAMGSENWMPNPIPITNVTIKNNLVIGSRIGVGYWGWSNYYSNIKIYHNTFWNGYGAMIYIDNPYVRGQAKDCEIRNNFFFVQDKYWAGTIGDMEKAAFTINSNYWYGMNWLPLPDTETSGSKAIDMANIQPEQLFFKDPMYGCSNNLYWNDQNISPYCFRPVNNGVWFNLMNGGSIPVKETVDDDFYNCRRNEYMPSIGYAESYLICNAMEKNNFFLY